uniref:Uncharacterized protein n=1 Tax=Kalanchoe fedtschenkoi TaxID=63787 RepID=A0A7N0VD42_KALFE
MEKRADLFPGTRKVNLKRLFKLSVHSLLTSCSKEEFSVAFSRFSSAEQTRLHLLFIQAEEQKRLIKTRVEQLREETSRPSNMAY